MVVNLFLYVVNIFYVLMVLCVWILVMGINVVYVYKEGLEMGLSLVVVLLNVWIIFVFWEWSVWILLWDFSVVFVWMGIKEMEVIVLILMRFLIL